MKRFFLILLGLILAGCEAQATPIAAVIVPTNTPLPTTASLPELRYAVASNLVPYKGDLEETIAIEVYDSNQPLSDYDVVVAYGIYDGWQQAPQSHRVSLVLNPNLPPFDDATIREMILQTLDVQAVLDTFAIPGVQQSSALTTESSTVLRTQLANAGYPDGFSVILATDVIPAVDILIGQLSQLALDIRLIEINNTVLSDNQAHMLLIMWSQERERATWSAQVGDDYVIDLWTMPISYVTPDDVQLEFNENGLPIPLD